MSSQHETVKNVSTVGFRVFFKTIYVRSKFHMITVQMNCCILRWPLCPEGAMPSGF